MKDKYVWKKVEGKEQWDLITTVKNGIGFTYNQCLGSIKYCFEREEYRFYQALMVFHLYGISEIKARVIADKLKELNHVLQNE